MDTKQLKYLRDEALNATYYKAYYRLRQAIFNYAFYKQTLYFQAGPIMYRIKPMSDQVEFAHDIEPNEWNSLDDEDPLDWEIFDSMAIDIEAMLPSELIKDYTL
jgi:hypothetical protein